MKKIIVAAALLISVVFNSYSQNTANKGYISISAGPSFPIGNYGNNDLNNPFSGHAKAGPSAAIFYSRLTGKHVGFSVALQVQRNPLDIKHLESNFSEVQISDGIWFGSTTDVPPPIVPFYSTYPNWKFEKDSWFTASLMAGGYAELPSKNNVSFISKVMIGVAYAKSPALKGISYTDTATATIEQTSGSGVGLSYSASGGIKYNMNKKISLLVNLEYFGTSKIRLDDITTTMTTTKGTPGAPGSTMSQSIRTVDGRQAIGSVNLSVGIGVSL